MCGIAGIISTSAAHERLTRVRRMVQLLVHRGPDDEGVWEHGRSMLGHRRLSIIDLTAAGHQPLLLS